MADKRHNVGVGRRSASHIERKVRRRTHTSSSWRKTGTNMSPAASESLHVQIPPSLPPIWLRMEATKIIWSHLCYSRGLLPMPAHQVVAAAETIRDQSSSRATRKMRQARAALLSLEHQWNLLGDIAHSIKYVLLSLGPSWNRPREVVLLNFQHLAESSSEVHTYSSESASKNRQVLSQKLLRAMMPLEANCAHYRGTNSALRLTVNVCIVGSDATPLLRELVGFPDSFVCRPNFNLSVRNLKRKLEMSVGGSPMSSLCLTSDLQNGIFDEGEWISLRSTVRGFR